MRSPVRLEQPVDGYEVLETRWMAAVRPSATGGMGVAVVVTVVITTLITDVVLALTIALSPVVVALVPPGLGWRQPCHRGETLGPGRVG